MTYVSIRGFFVLLTPLRKVSFLMTSLILSSAIGLAGALGAVARYLFGRFMAERIPSPFPLGTFIINISGAFLIGLLFALTTKKFLHPPHNQSWQPALWAASPRLVRELGNSAARTQRQHHTQFSLPRRHLRTRPLCGNPGHHARAGALNGDNTFSTSTHPGGLRRWVLWHNCTCSPQYADPITPRQWLAL